MLAVQFVMIEGKAAGMSLWPATQAAVQQIALPNVFISDRETDTVTDRDRDYIKYTETEITQSGTQTDARTDRQRRDRDRECTGMHVSK
jgi:hypothetical protein